MRGFRCIQCFFIILVPEARAHVLAAVHALRALLDTQSKMQQLL